jgi:hypothetical protein
MGSDGGRRLVLVAMIFAVAMTFIDQTIVAIAIPELQASEAFGALRDNAQAAFEATQLDYALSLRTVYYVLAAVMAVSFVVAALTLPGGHSSADDAMPAGG